MIKRYIKVLVLILIPLILFSCKSNYTKIGDKKANYIPYYLKVYEADSLNIVGDYQRSYKILDSLFERYEPINMPLYFEYENYIKLSYQLNKKSKKSIIKLAKYYNYNLDDIKQDSILSHALNKSKIREKRIINMYNQFEKKIDTVYRHLIHNMNLNDQKVRNEVYINWNNVKKVDLENDSILKLKLKTIGFPTIRKVGNYKKISTETNSKDVSQDVILIHLSVDNDLFKSYEKLFFDYLKKGYLSPKIYANMIDKNYYKNNNTSYYYFMFSNLQAEKMDLLIKNKINSKRKLAGLPCLDYDELFTKKRIFNN
jgi:hypothetical protein